MCQEVLFPNAAGRYCFRQHWRAREAEILVLAARGQEKKLRARRLETLADTTLCKGQPLGMCGGAPEHIMEAALVGSKYCVSFVRRSEFFVPATRLAYMFA